MSPTRLLLSLLLLGTGLLAVGQQPHISYATLIGEAWQLYQQKSWRESAQKYMEAFAVKDAKVIANDRYNAACSWALTGETDSAFAQLSLLAHTPRYTEDVHASSDPDLFSLHGDVRWTLLIAKIKANREAAEARLDRELVAILDTILRHDQDGRLQLGEIEQKYGRESEELAAHWRLIEEKDSINLVKVSRILDERGWLGSDVIGQRGNQTLFLVIQHAGLEAQQKYLPLMREAARAGNASPSSLAMLEDRIALKEGRSQVYGTQIGRDGETGDHYILPLEDPDNVDQRRAAVGLGPISEYIARWELTWDAEAYKKRLPAIKARRGMQ